MRRLALIISLVVLSAACSGGSSDDTTTTTTTTTAPSTTAAATTTTTTTTTAPTTSTTISATTSAAPEDLAFDTLSGTPPNAFDSYSATMTMKMHMQDVDISATTEGVWTTDAFQCTLTSGLGGFNLSESIIGTPQTLWYDQGTGYEVSDLTDQGAQSVMSNCPASPLFWTSFTTDNMGDVNGEETTYNGRTAYKADLSDLLDALGGLGMVDLQGSDVNQMTVWIDAETNTVIALAAELQMSAEALGATTGDTVTMTMEVSLDRFNDPTLIIEEP